MFAAAVVVVGTELPAAAAVAAVAAAAVEWKYLGSDTVSAAGHSEDLREGGDSKCTSILNYTSVR